MMTVSEARFITSAPTIKEAPDLRGIPEVVLLGRSNVGKSTFINALTGNGNLAKTSNTPGKTRLMNFYKIKLARGKTSQQVLDFAFVDLPGYGYAKVSKTEQEEWRKSLTHFLKQREEIALCIQLIDARHGPQENDIAMFDWLAQEELPQLIMLTKADKLKKREIEEQRLQAAETLQVDSAHVVPFSGIRPANRDAVWGLLWETLAAN